MLTIRSTPGQLTGHSIGENLAVESRSGEQSVGHQQSDTFVRGASQELSGQTGTLSADRMNQTTAVKSFQRQQKMLENLSRLAVKLQGLSYRSSSDSTMTDLHRKLSDRHFQVVLSEFIRVGQQIDHEQRSLRDKALPETVTAQLKLPAMFHSPVDPIVGSFKVLEICMDLERASIATVSDAYNAMNKVHLMESKLKKIMGCAYAVQSTLAERTQYRWLDRPFEAESDEIIFRVENNSRQQLHDHQASVASPGSHPAEAPGLESQVSEDRSDLQRAAERVHSQQRLLETVGQLAVKIRRLCLRGACDEAMTGPNRRLLERRFQEILSDFDRKKIQAGQEERSILDPSFPTAIAQHLELPQSCQDSAEPKIPFLGTCEACSELGGASILTVDGAKTWLKKVDQTILRLQIISARLCASQSALNERKQYRWSEPNEDSRNTETCSREAMPNFMSAPLDASSSHR